MPLPERDRRIADFEKSKAQKAQARESAADSRETGPSEQVSFLEAGPATHSGHRQRLRKRFLLGGPEALPDYELLELVLFRVFARKDTKDLAKRLIALFGSFAEVINAPA